MFALIQQCDLLYFFCCYETFSILLKKGKIMLSSSRTSFTLNRNYCSQNGNFHLHSSSFNCYTTIAHVYWIENAFLITVFLHMELTVSQILFYIHVIANLTISNKKSFSLQHFPLPLKTKWKIHLKIKIQNNKYYFIWFVKRLRVWGSI